MKPWTRWLLLAFPWKPAIIGTYMTEQPSKDSWNQKQQMYEIYRPWDRYTTPNSKCIGAEWLRLSRRACDTAATMLHHSRHRGESVTKTVKFFVAHTVNYVICNNHTRIDWALLYFTPVIRQNYHQPGRKFDKSFCGVDRLSYQLGLSKSETSQFRSDLFLIS